MNPRSHAPGRSWAPVLLLWAALSTLLAAPGTGQQASRRRPLIVKPKALKFGNVSVGSTKSLQFAIQNATSNLVVFVLETPVGFRVLGRTGQDLSNTRMDLASGVTVPAFVEFGPADGQSVSKTLILSEATTGVPLATIRLTGKGVQPALVIEPAILDLGEWVPGNEKTLDYKIRNTTSRPADFKMFMENVQGDAFLELEHENYAPANDYAYTGYVAHFLPEHAQEYTGVVRLTDLRGREITRKTLRGFGKLPTQKPSQSPACSSRAVGKRLEPVSSSAVVQ